MFSVWQTLELPWRTTSGNAWGDYHDYINRSGKTCSLWVPPYSGWCPGLYVKKVSWVTACIHHLLLPDSRCNVISQFNLLLPWLPLNAHNMSRDNLRSMERMNERQRYEIGSLESSRRNRLGNSLRQSAAVPICSSSRYSRMPSPLRLPKNRQTNHIVVDIYHPAETD